MMKIIFCLALSFAFIATIYGQNNPDFSGYWTINIERTKSPITVVTKNIKQRNGEIEIINDPDLIKVVANKEAPATVYKLGGEEILKEIETTAGKIPVLYSAKFVTGTLELSRKQKGTQDQSVSSSVMEIWSLMDEGKTLNIKSVFSNSDGEKLSEVSFDKSLAEYDDKQNKVEAINGKARQLIKPAYPKEAREVKAQGNVFVRVLVDEKGNVVFAKAVYGNPMLLQTSEQAALLCKFSPTKINSIPIKAGGVIVYSFAKM